MKYDDGVTLSLWDATIKFPEFTSLENNATADVCVVGGGIAGLTTAYLLAKEGKNVILVDDGKIGYGETHRTTAHLSNVIDDRFYEIERMHGEDGLKLATESHTSAIDLIEKIINDEKIDCDFTRLPGYLFFLDAQEEEAEKEFEAARKAGLSPQKINKNEIPQLTNGICLKFDQQGQFHIGKYMAGLAKAATQSGVRIYTGTHINEIKKKEEKGITLKTKEGLSISCDDAVVATNSPVSDFVSMHLKQAAYISYVIGAKVPKGSVPLALYWDNESPYHYVRLQSFDGYDILIVGGEDHKTGQADDMPERYKKLEEWARERFPQMQEVIHKWSGQVMEPVDGLSYTGLDPEYKKNVYIITADSGMGMTHGTYSALLIKDLITGKYNEWAKLYDPSRITLSAAKEFISETANMALQYIDLITGGDVDALEEITPGEGAVIRSGLKKIAVYKDHEGRVFGFNALCTHLKCVVHWNKNEKTWDCPCHGSRFDALGKVINGPAISDLKRIKLEEEVKSDNS